MSQPLSATKLLARMVANSTAFQREVNADGEADAYKRVHRMLVLKPEDLPRPFSVVDFGDLNSSRTNGGARNSYAFDAHLTWSLAGRVSNPNDVEESLERFWEWSQEVFYDVHLLGGYDDHLNIIAATQTQKPVLTSEQRGTREQYIWTEWRIEYGTF